MPIMHSLKHFESHFIRFIVLIIFCPCYFFFACNADTEPNVYEEKLQRDKQAIQNQCASDADCHVSGCHRTLCRATFEDDFCEHRFVVRLDEESDLLALLAYVRGLLTEREAETLQSGGYATNLWTISFHASLSQRARVMDALRALAYSGFAKLDKDARSLSVSLSQELGINDRDISLKTMQGAGPLVEKLIRSGDVLSRNDISKTWEALSPQLADSSESRFQWDYDVVIDTKSSIRLWPVYKNERISVFHWKEFSYFVDAEDIVVSGELSQKQAEILQRWSKSEELILLTLGREVLTAASVKQAIEDGEFELRLHRGAKKRELLKQLTTLQRLFDMSGGVQFDEHATAQVERDISCSKKLKRDCACVQGHCQWRVNKEFNECMTLPSQD